MKIVDGMGPKTSDILDYLISLDGPGRSINGQSSILN